MSKLQWISLYDAVLSIRDKDSKVYLTVDMRDKHIIVTNTEKDLVTGSILPVNEVLEVLYLKDWIWWKNTRCKYVKLHIDPTSKVCNVYDRRGVGITLEELKKQ